MTRRKTKHRRTERGQPDRQPVETLVARLTVGAMNKAIVVHGDRSWRPDGTPSKPSPFTTAPLR